MNHLRIGQSLMEGQNEIFASYAGCKLHGTPTHALEIWFKIFWANPFSLFTLILGHYSQKLLLLNKFLKYTYNLQEKRRKMKDKIN